jgi:hypothetical protein
MRAVLRPVVDKQPAVVPPVKELGFDQRFYEMLRLDLVRHAAEFGDLFIGVPSDTSVFGVIRRLVPQTFHDAVRVGEWDLQQPREYFHLGVVYGLVFHFEGSPNERHLRVVFRFVLLMTLLFFPNRESLTKPRPHSDPQSSITAILVSGSIRRGLRGAVGSYVGQGINRSSLSVTQ